MPFSSTQGIALETTARMLVTGWATHFQSLDSKLNYTHVETARFLRIEEAKVLLVGIVDAEGPDFFSEHKTASPKGEKTWKKEWLMSPQALTYGLLTGGTKRFLVRKAFKKTNPTFDHEWFEFSANDLSMWRRQVGIIGQEIRLYRKDEAADTIPWPLNLEHGCFAYGAAYPCPYWQSGCTKHNFNGPIPGSTPFEFFPEFQGANRSMLAEQHQSIDTTWIVLSATRIKNWMRCREKYRRDQELSFPPSEAMLLGSRFHDLIAQHYRRFLPTAPSVQG